MWISNKFWSSLMEPNMELMSPMICCYEPWWDKAAWCSTTRIHNWSFLQRRRRQLRRRGDDDDYDNDDDFDDDDDDDYDNDERLRRRLRRRQQQQLNPISSPGSIPKWTLSRCLRDRWWTEGVGRAESPTWCSRSDWTVRGRFLRKTAASAAAKMTMMAFRAEQDKSLNWVLKILIIIMRCWLFEANQPTKHYSSLHRLLL